MKKIKISSNNILLLITVALFVVMYGAGCIVYASKGFTHLQTFLNVLINNAGLICVAAGTTCVMLTGGIDISVGSLVAMDCMILAVGIEQKGMSSITLMIFILAIGLVFGLVQGYLIAYLQIQPFIATMAGMFFARGMTAVICTEQVSIVSDAFFVGISNAKINIPFGIGAYMNKKGILQIPYVRPTVIVALLVVVLIYRSPYFLNVEVHQVWQKHLCGGRQSDVCYADGSECGKDQDAYLCACKLPLLDRRYLLLPEHNVWYDDAGGRL